MSIIIVSSETLNRDKDHLPAQHAYVINVIMAVSVLRKLVWLTLELPGTLMLSMVAAIDDLARVSQHPSSSAVFFLIPSYPPHPPKYSLHYSPRRSPSQSPPP